MIRLFRYFWHRKQIIGILEDVADTLPEPNFIGEVKRSDIRLMRIQGILSRIKRIDGVSSRRD